MPIGKDTSSGDHFDKACW